MAKQKFLRLQMLQVEFPNIQEEIISVTRSM